MIEPFNAVGLVPTVWGVRNRREIEKNIEHLALNIGRIEIMYNEIRPPPPPDLPSGI